MASSFACISCLALATALPKSYILISVHCCGQLGPTTQMSETCSQQLPRQPRQLDWIAASSCKPPVFSIGSQLRAANLLFFRLDRNIVLQTSCFSIGSQVRAASLMLFRLDRSLELQASCFSIGSGLRAAPRVFPNRPTTLCNPSAASSQGVGGKGGSL